jgi:hypothetical protein
MRWHRCLLSIVLPLSLAGCAIGGAGIGSLVAGGLQALGGDSSGASNNTGPFRTVDNSQTIQQLDDLASRAVSQACAAEMERYTSSEAPSTKDQAEASDQPSAEDRDDRCAYRNICLPGNTRPLRMLVCRNDPAMPTVAHAETQDPTDRR